MHLLGKTFRAFAITPDGEAINLIKIDDWDYKWQLTYQFKELLTVPGGSVIIAEGLYDNTAQNPLNPNNPVRGRWLWLELHRRNDESGLLLYCKERKNERVKERSAVAAVS